ncbi:MAG: glycosyltransferase [Propionibacteriaceae bacterium]|nr:glycosyltransferase [Propionibacteriaceae bacterium]
MSKSVLLYGDVSLNVVDGSSIWLISMAEVLSRVADEVHLLSKVQVNSDLLLGQLLRIPNVVVHPPDPDKPLHVDGQPEVVLNVSSARRRLTDLAAKFDPVAVITRGFDLSHEVCQESSISYRLWSYVTDLPYPMDRFSERGLGRIRRIGTQSRWMFAQTEAARSYLEALCPSACGKTQLMFPMVMDTAWELAPRDRGPDDPVRLVYSGKFAKDWRTLEMLALPRLLGSKGLPAELWMVGNKFQKDKADPTWHVRMEAAIRAADADPSSGVRWLGGVSRDESLRLIAQCEIGLGWRTEALDGSLEMSTKALEYGACGLAPLINKSEDHADLFGSDYPLFASGEMGVDELAQLIVDTYPRLDSLRHQSRALTSEYSMAAAAKRMKRLLHREPGVGSQTRLAMGGRSLRLGIASHDLKFMGELLANFSRHPDLEVRIDHWASLREHDVPSSEQILDWADIILCEWAGPNAAWYARRKRPEQSLIVRLHGFEFRSGLSDGIDFEAVSRVITVSSFYRQKVLDRYSLPGEKVQTIPNIVDIADLSRPKLPGAQFRLGMAGWVGFSKRPDRALELIKGLLQEDPRYVLYLKGRMPWEYFYEWDKPLVRQLYAEFFAELSASSTLRSHVVFEPFGADIASWQRKIGFMLSPSDFESFHLAPAEGMASGSVPIVWARDGAKEVFSDRWVIGSTDEAIERILQLRERPSWEEESATARTYATRWSEENILHHWYSLLQQVFPISQF